MVGLIGSRKALDLIEQHIGELFGRPRILLPDLRLILRKVFEAVGVSVRIEDRE
jgi:hypothetical protein